MSDLNESALGAGDDNFTGTAGNDSALGLAGHDSILRIASKAWLRSVLRE